MEWLNQASPLSGAQILIFAARARFMPPACHLCTGHRSLRLTEARDLAMMIIIPLCQENLMSATSTRR